MISAVLDLLLSSSASLDMCRIGESFDLHCGKVLIMTSERKHDSVFDKIDFSRMGGRLCWLTCHCQGFSAFSPFG